MTRSLGSKRVLITGATGFIGSHLARRLHDEGAEIHILLRKESSTYRIRDIIKSVVLWQGDLTDPRSLHSCIRHAKPQIVFHLATSRNVLRDAALMDVMIDTNVKGTVNLVKSLIDEEVAVECFVNTGTCEEYGNAPTPFHEDMREMPVSPYSASKVAATYFCQMVYRTMGLPIVTLRPFLVYGPSQDTDVMFIPSLIDHCLKDKDFPMTTGDQTREFNYIDDVVDAYLLAAQCRNAAGEIINIGNGIEYRLKDVADRIVQITGSSTRLLVGAIPKRSGETEHFFCSDEKAKRLLRWEPKISLDAGLQKTIDWYRNNL